MMLRCCIASCKIARICASPSHLTMPFFTPTLVHHTAEDFDGVDQVYVAMLDAGHEPDSAFELEVERAQERQQQEFVQRRLDEANGVAPG